MSASGHPRPSLSLGVSLFQTPSTLSLALERLPASAAGLCLKLLRGDTGEREVVADGGCWAQVTTHQFPSRTARKEGSGNSGTSGLGCCSQKRSFPGLNLAPGDSLAPRDGLG